MISDADMAAIIQLSEDIKAAIVGLSVVTGAKPSRMLAAMVVAMAELNLDHTKPGHEQWSLEQMLDGIRAMHDDLMENRQIQDMADAAEARQRGSIQ
jgi:ATP-dependent DNA ligase